MKFLLMMNHAGKGPYAMASWQQEDIKRHIDFMRTFSKNLSERGELVGAEGLAGPDQAKLVKSAKDGKPITDGVFPETKEFLVGYWMIQVDTAERAYEIAAEASRAPGKDAEPLYMNIEVREIMAFVPAKEFV